MCYFLKLGFTIFCVCGPNKVRCRPRKVQLLRSRALLSIDIPSFCVNVDILKRKNLLFTFHFSCVLFFMCHSIIATTNSNFRSNFTYFHLFIIYFSQPASLPRLPAASGQFIDLSMSIICQSLFLNDHLSELALAGCLAS